MQVQVGPVASESVTQWCRYARKVLSMVFASPGVGLTRLSPEVRATFERYLTIWSDLAEQDSVFVWCVELDAEEIEFLAHAWFRLAAAVATEPDFIDVPANPPEGEEFHQSLLTAMLDAFSHEGRSLAEFAEQLRDSWPGLNPS